MVTPRLPSASLSRFCACARVRVRAFSRGGMNAAAKRPLVLSPCRPARSNLEASPAFAFAFAFDVLDATKKMMTHKGRGERANNSGNQNHNHFMPARRLPAWSKHLVETPGRNETSRGQGETWTKVPCMTARHYFLPNAITGFLTTSRFGGSHAGTKVKSRATTDTPFSSSTCFCFSFPRLFGLTNFTPPDVRRTVRGRANAHAAWTRKHGCKRRKKFWRIRPCSGYGGGRV